MFCSEKFAKRATCFGSYFDFKVVSYLNMRKFCFKIYIVSRLPVISAIFVISSLRCTHVYLKGLNIEKECISRIDTQ
jgi:hypothetical protein